VLRVSSTEMLIVEGRPKTVWRGLRGLLERRCKRWPGWGGVIGCGNDHVLVVTSILASCIDGLAVRIRTPSEPFLILTTV